jgi:hypothetical protein
VVRGAAQRPKHRRGPLGRLAERFVHPMARKRRTAAHVRVLHRQSYSGLVTEISTERFEMDEHTRRVLGLDPGPPRTPVRDDAGAGGTDTLSPAVPPGDEEPNRAAEAVGGVEHAAPESVAAAAPPDDPATQPLSVVDALDPLAEAISRALTDLGAGDDARQP